MKDGILREILGSRRRELQGQEYEEIRLILALLDPVDTGNSLHCWDATYHYNDKVYQIVGEFSSPDAPPIIDELLEWENTDK